MVFSIPKKTGYAFYTLNFRRTGFLKCNGAEAELYYYFVSKAMLCLLYPCNGKWTFHHLRKFTSREHPFLSFSSHGSYLTLRIVNLEHRRNKNQNKTKVKNKTTQNKQTKKKTERHPIDSLLSSAPYVPSYWGGRDGKTIQ